jgi:hypothetical protein
VAPNLGGPKQCLYSAMTVLPETSDREVSTARRKRWNDSTYEGTVARMNSTHLCRNKIHRLVKDLGFDCRGLFPQAVAAIGDTQKVMLHVEM